MALRVRLFEPADLEPVIGLWHRTTVATYTFLPGESSRTIDEARAAFRSLILPACTLHVAVSDARIVGFLATKPGARGRHLYVDRIYVDPAEQRRGAGRALMDVAFAASPGRIRLHTHQENTGARRFYERLGFRAIAFGTSPPPESAPDVMYEWVRG
ncbi:MAG: putative N-acetyltransferase YjaB [Planctomycetes bacterium]|nr:putative N-acetyltransferase YjaB [Planctomycetota bacterium]